MREGELVARCPRRAMPVSSSSAASARPGPRGWITAAAGRHDGPVCRLEIFGPWVPALEGVEVSTAISKMVLLASSVARDMVLQSPKNNADRPAARFRCVPRCC